MVGLTEELINALTKLGGLRVVARTSAFFFKDKNMPIRDIGRELRVENILEGSVRKSGDKLRITGQLVNVADGYHLWSERYDRDIDDVFAVQDEITSAIVNKLKPKLLGKEEQRIGRRQTVDIEAYSLYLRGRFFWNKRTPEALEKAREYFERAIEKDPDYALAYAGLADYYLLLPVYCYLAPRDAFPHAKEAALKALALNDTLAEAHTSLGFLKYFYEWDWEGGGREYERAIELNPGYATARQRHAGNLRNMGRPKEAEKEFRKALELDPLSPAINRDFVNIILATSGRYDQAIELLEKTIELEPGSATYYVDLGGIYLLKGLYEKAVKAFENAMALSLGRNPQAEVAIGIAYAFMGRHDKARKMLEDLMEQAKKEYVPPCYVAALSFSLRDTDQGFEWLDKAYGERDYFLPIFMWMPLIDILDLRSDSRYKALMKKMNLDT